MNDTLQSGRVLPKLAARATQSVPLGGRPFDFRAIAALDDDTCDGVPPLQNPGSHSTRDSSHFAASP